MSHGTPLSGLRVVELGILPAAAYCARLLGDLGAEVIRLADDSDPVDHAATEAGAWFGFLHYGKTIGTGNVDALLAEADICIDSRPTASISARPGLIHVNVSWFGRSGPYADFAGSDAGCRALALWVETDHPRIHCRLGAPTVRVRVGSGSTPCSPLVSQSRFRRR